MNGKHFGEGEEKKHLTTRESYEEKKKPNKNRTNLLRKENQ